MLYKIFKMDLSRNEKFGGAVVESNDEMGSPNLSDRIVLEVAFEPREHRFDFWGIKMKDCAGADVDIRLAKYLQVGSLSRAALPCHVKPIFARTGIPAARLRPIFRHFREIDNFLPINERTQFDAEVIELFRVIVECRSEEHTSELQSRRNIVCRLLLEKKNYNTFPLGHSSV